MMANTVSAQDSPRRIESMAAVSVRPAEKDLLQRCLDGERLAQKQLYTQYSQAMFTLAFRITNNHDLAHDVLQEAFIEVFRDLKNFKGISTLGAWIKTIVVRKAGKQTKFEQRFESFDDKHDIGIPYHQFTSQALEREILNLPEGYRTVFTLVEVEGYKHTEIAQMLGISESTSRTQLYHAKRVLREKLANEWEG
ncbi:MAG: RNA polymerase sigma factor [Bacteroidia bacterium]